MLIEAPYLVWLIPFLGAVLVIGARYIHRYLASGIAILSGALSMLFAYTLVPDVLTGIITLFDGKQLGNLPYDWSFPWTYFYDATGNAFVVSFGMLIDPLTVFMLIVVTTISFLILVYSLEYMEHESTMELGRYWFWMLIFIGSMCLLVSADNFILMFFGWELVGLCSWQLISFWHNKTTPSPTPEFETEGEYNAHCGLKAFIMTSFGDIFLLLGMLLIGWATFQSFGHLEFNFLKLQDDITWMKTLSDAGLIGIFGILIFGGAVGKSAQFPLHEWLPEAMAGPTTVSALIHAATMVKAGVYLVARIIPIFYLGLTSGGYVDLKDFFMAVAFIGAFTAFLAATQGMVAQEVKKVLAYSTVSQIGYMMLILGTVGLLIKEAVYEAYFAGMFHLMAHAVFKALLFLSAGVLLHKLHTKSMMEMGGLKDKMPLTFVVMLIGAASLAGIPPLSGFYSKEHIFSVLFAENDPLILILFGFAAVTAILTVFYSFRMIGLIFYGEPSSHINEMLTTHPEKVKDPSWIMLGPLTILAFFSVTIGFINNAVADFLFKRGAFGANEAEITQNLIDAVIAPFLSITFVITVIILVIGFVPAYLLYFKRSLDPETIVNSNPLFRGLYRFFWNRWYINALYYKLFVDGVQYVAEQLRKIQTGRLGTNIKYMLIGFLLISILGILSLGGL